jgi:hypothetical protein
MKIGQVWIATRRREEHVGQIQPVGRRIQREIDVDCLRLLLGEEPTQSEIPAGEAPGQKEEDSSLLKK